MATPERELADAMISDLESHGLLDSGRSLHAKAVLLKHLLQEKRRGLKDNEVAQLVNAIRDGLAPICKSQQLRGRIASVLTSKLWEMGLSLDGGEHIVGACPKTIVPILDNKKWCAWCNDSHVVGGCPRVPGG